MLEVWGGACSQAGSHLPDARLLGTQAMGTAPTWRQVCPGRRMSWDPVESLGVNLGTGAMWLSPRKRSLETWCTFRETEVE